MSTQRNDDEYQWLLDQGVPPMHLNDMWFRFLRSLGYKGALDDMMREWWLGGGVVPPPIGGFGSGFSTGFN